jgi:thioredoxin reductase (NADPH)
MQNPPVEQAEVLVLGAGPAGINCALELNDEKINCLIVDRNASAGGQLPEIPTEITNLAVGRFSNGRELQQRLGELVQAANLNLVSNENIVSCDLKAGSAASASRIYQARAIFLATGYRLKLLPENESFKRFSNDIFYHTGSVQDQFVNRRVAIIGGGDSAVLEALERARTASEVVLINRSDKYKARLDLIRDLRSNSRIKVMSNASLGEMYGDEGLQEIRVHSTTGDTTEICKIDKVIVKIGYLPNTEIFKGQIEMDSTGHIRVESDCRTSLAGIFAGGDIAAGGHDRIAYALGNGVMAARSIRRYLESQS